MQNLSSYKSIIFDCDGIVLNSNNIKTSGFEYALRFFNKRDVKSFLKYHKKNGGVSRQIKFKYFFEKITQKSFSPELLEKVMNDYSYYIYNGLLNCEIEKSLFKIKKLTEHIPWYIISGGSEKELREIFKIRNINTLFDGGIYGNPKSKDLIIKEQLETNSLLLPAIYFGDSRYDYEVCKSYSIDFIFISQWSEFKDHEIWCIEEKITSFKSFEDYLNGQRLL